MMDREIEKALKGLLLKYNIQEGGQLNLLPGYDFIGKELENNDVPLPIWRINRKFIELNQIVSNHTIENVCMLRFCSMGSKSQWSLAALLYKEFDLCEFIIGREITSLHATFTDGATGNVIIKFCNGAIGSVEVSNQVPEGNSFIERHEVIAQRGIASDIAVDVQLPQYSVYLFTERGEAIYKDVDFELFGLDENQVAYVRSAFNAIKNPEQTEELKDQHNHLCHLIKLAFESDSKKQKIVV